MTTLKIAGASTFQRVAGDAGDDLTAELKTVCERPPRRLNRFIQLALIGAHRCAAGIDGMGDAGCDVYLGSGQGNVADTINLLRDIHGARQAPMPFGFINVSSNMAGFYIAQSLGLKGANLAVSRQDSSFEACLELAAAEAERRPSALVGAVDECAWPLAQHRRRLGVDADTRLGEGSHWLWIDQRNPAPVAEVTWVRRFGSLGAMEDAAASHGAQGLTVGYGLVRSGEAASQMAGASRLVEYTGAEPYYETLSAYAVCRFVETAVPGERMVHLNRDAAGGYYGVALRKF